MKELEFKLDMAAKLARKGRVSRRDFVQLALAAGFTAAAANTMFTRRPAPSPRRAALLQDRHAGMAPRPIRWTPAIYPDQCTGTACWGTMSQQPDRDRRQG